MAPPKPWQELGTSSASAMTFPRSLAGRREAVRPAGGSRVRPRPAHRLALARVFGAKSLPAPPCTWRDRSSSGTAGQSKGSPRLSMAARLQSIGRLRAHMRTETRCAGSALVAVLLATAYPTQGLAHPHVWITGNEQIQFNRQGEITGVTHAWVFDQMYSAFATQGLGKNGGIATKEELAPLAKTNVESLAEFEYFTFAKL